MGEQDDFLARRARREQKRRNRDVAAMLGILIIVLVILTRGAWGAAQGDWGAVQASLIMAGVLFGIGALSAWGAGWRL